VATLAALTDADSLAKGQALFTSQTSLCSSCHRPDLGGLVGPDVTDERWLHGCTPGEVVRSITTGYPPRGMLPYGGGPKLSDEQLLQLASFVLSKRGSHPPNPKPVDAAREKPCG
jgi:cytochrome c oxidase cbb3-type subunit 3